MDMEWNQLDSFGIPFFHVPVTKDSKAEAEAKHLALLSEHDIDFIAKLCDRVIVMAEGKILTEGRMEEIKKNEDVITAYLGRSGAV